MAKKETTAKDNGPLTTPGPSPAIAQEVSPGKVNSPATRPSLRQVASWYKFPLLLLLLSLSFIVLLVTAYKLGQRSMRDYEGDMPYQRGQMMRDYDMGGRRNYTLQNTPESSSPTLNTQNL
ncbi:MAG: hypothetical protein WBO35_02585 [Candidatus Saccharimonadales bacterium]